MTQYLYPQNLKAKANLWLWGLRDFTILCVAILLSAVVLVHSGILLPAAVSLCFGFLTIRAADDYGLPALCRPLFSYHTAIL